MPRSCRSENGHENRPNQGVARESTKDVGSPGLSQKLADLLIAGKIKDPHHAKPANSPTRIPSKDPSRKNDLIIPSSTLQGQYFLVFVTKLPASERP